ncbi:cell division protein FtsQ/DivIB [Desulfosoma sp.]
MMRSKWNRYRKDPHRVGGPIHWAVVLLMLGFTVVSVVGLSAALARAYGVLLDAPVLTVDAVAIRGATKLERKEILDALGVPKGTNMLRLRLDVLATRLEKLPWVRSARVDMEPSGRLLITLDERKPKAVVMGVRPYLMDEDGVLFLEVKPEVYTELPYVTKVGNKIHTLGDRLPASFLKAFQELLEAVEGASGFGVRFISEILWDPLEGMTIFANPKGTRIHLGTGEYARKMRRLRAVLKAVERRTGLDVLEVVDLSYPDRAYIQGRFQKPQGV